MVQTRDCGYTYSSAVHSTVHTALSGGQPTRQPDEGRCPARALLRHPPSFSRCTVYLLACALRDAGLMRPKCSSRASSRQSPSNVHRRRSIRPSPQETAGRNGSAEQLECTVLVSNGWAPPT
eukprot:7390403-Prymnesium_polylepis.1